MYNNPNALQFNQLPIDLQLFTIPTCNNVFHSCFCPLCNSRHICHRGISIWVLYMRILISDVSVVGMFTYILRRLLFTSQCLTMVRSYTKQTLNFCLLCSSVNQNFCLQFLHYQSNMASILKFFIILVFVV